MERTYVASRVQDQPADFALSFLFAARRDPQEGAFVIIRCDETRAVRVNCSSDAYFLWMLDVRLLPNSFCSVVSRRMIRGTSGQERGQRGG